LDSEASANGQEVTGDDVHTIQVCSSEGERTGRVFWNPQEFRSWYRGLRSDRRPQIFYAFTLPFEYGSLAAWELLGARDQRGCYPWQSYLEDQPVNLFYIQPFPRRQIAVYDVRPLFFQLRYGNYYLTSLEKLGDYLSASYGEDIHKLPHPLGADFGKRHPTQTERPEFERYGIRDAYICARAAQWIQENVLEKWLENKASIEEIYSWGTIAKRYFDLPKIGQVLATRRNGSYIVGFKNKWHEEILHSCYAGRNEAFWTGNVGQVHYNDVVSLYPLSLIQSQAMLIKDVRAWNGDSDRLLGRMNWKRFLDATGCPYGWILGDFRTDDDLWGLPTRCGENNIYVTGRLAGQLYHTLDLQASNAEVLDVQFVLIPQFVKDDPQFVNMMHKYEELARVKLLGEYASEIEKYCVKNTLNCATGILGQADPDIALTTNPPAYSTTLAQSHLLMSEVFHKYHTPTRPVYYTDTDSFFWHNPVNETIRMCRSYPTLPFQILTEYPLNISEKGTIRKEGCIIFRGKMYYQSKLSQAFSGWKPFPQFFGQIVETKPREIWVERQITRKWKSKDHRALVLRVGRWHIIREHWSLPKLKTIFRADHKRQRETHDSYQLFLDDECRPSRAPTANELYNEMAKPQVELIVAA
jgi:hypothetical protein